MSNAVHQFVSEERLRRDISSTGKFGKVQSVGGNGRTVLTGTKPDKHAREYFVDRIRDAGLAVRIDEVGNIGGLWVPDGVSESVPAVGTGSHLDSVTEGGIFDGVLGVYAGLEAVRAIQAADVDVNRPIEVVSFTEEEGGRFSDGVLGSSVAIGERSVDDALALEDSDDISCREALEGIGFRGEGLLDASEWDSWVELHVEQSTKLENAGVPVGIVTDITGTIRCHIEIVGEANHAGTTSMGHRTDALTAASELVLEVESVTRDIVDETSSTAVATVGEFDVYPNCINVIPGTVHLGVDIRDVSYDSMEQIVSSIRDCLNRLESDHDVETEFAKPYDIPPISMDDRCIAAFRRGTSITDLETIDMHSGAGHDTMHVAKVTDAGMIFAPSRGGLSHSPEEWTDWKDCTAATSVLAEAIYDLATT